MQKKKFSSPLSIIVPDFVSMNRDYDGQAITLVQEDPKRGKVRIEG
jgi:hypothetical protein